MTISLETQIKCIAREIKFREAVYSKRIAGGKMSRIEADNEIATMQAVLETLQGLREPGPEQIGLFGGPQ